MKNKFIWGTIALIALVAFWIVRHSGSEQDTPDSAIASPAADAEVSDLKSALSVSLVEDLVEDKYVIGWQINITNVGQGPITIQRFQVNGRSDCDAKVNPLPKTLNVGDVAGIYSPCQSVVRAHIVTDQGEADFTFDPVTHLAN
jgi:hypothetical protein